MFLFLEFILDNVCEYTTLFELLGTSRSARQLFSRYYRHHALTALARSNSRFMKLLYRIKVFQIPSVVRCQLCVVLDFFHTQPSFDIHRPVYIESELFWYSCSGIPTRKKDRRHTYYRIRCKDWKDFDADACGQPADVYCGDEEYFRVGHHYKDEGKPFEFSLQNKNSVYTGILYSEAQYVKQKNKSCYYGRMDRGDIFDRPYREIFHVLHSMQTIWILVLLEFPALGSAPKKRCALQLRYPTHAESTIAVEHRYRRFNAIIDDRFGAQQSLCLFSCGSRNKQLLVDY